MVDKDGTRPVDDFPLLGWVLWIRQQDGYKSLPLILVGSFLTNVGFYHLQWLRQLRCDVSQAAVKQLMSAIILSRLDYCNSVLTGLPWSTIAPLQHVQNASARIVSFFSPLDHVRPALRELHWLPITYCIKFKIALLMYLAHIHRYPSYVSYNFSPVSNNAFRHWLHSSDGTDYIIPYTNTKFGEQALCVSVTSLWNASLETIRAATDPRLFKKNPKEWIYSTSSTESCWNCHYYIVKMWKSWLIHGQWSSVPGGPWMSEAVHWIPVVSWLQMWSVICEQPVPNQAWCV